MKKMFLSTMLLLSFAAFATAFTAEENDERCCCGECRCEKCVCDERCDECRDCHGYYCEECDERHEFRRHEDCCRDYRRHEYRRDHRHRHHDGCCHEERRRGCCH